MTSLVPATTITAPVTGQVVGGLVKYNARPDTLGIQGNFSGGASGSTAQVYVQTTFDKGSTWIDILSLAFTGTSSRVVVNLSSRTAVTTAYAATDGSLSTGAKDGLLGDQFRAKLTTTGTYSGGTSIAIDLSSNQV